MKKVIMLCAFLVISGAMPVHSKVVDIIFNQDFYRSTSKPLMETVTFEAINGQATITVTNGSLENSEIERVSSSVISLNGNIVISPSNFNQQVQRIEKIVRLNHGVNTLSVNIKGKPGGKLNITISQEAEVIAELPPSGGSVLVADPQSPISGTEIVISPESIPSYVDKVEISRL
jgi:hypothetical protein